VSNQRFRAALSALTLILEKEQVSETLVFNSALTWLIAREDFIAFICSESFKSYNFLTILNFSNEELKHKYFFLENIANLPIAD
jgi:hypothetical protein